MVRVRINLKSLAMVGALLSAMGAAIPARAQTPASEDLSRGVARISLMDGEVSVRRGDSGEWVAGVINAPLMTDDRIATGQNSRAEVQFDAANILRMGGNTEIHLALLENDRYHVEISKGTVTYRMLRQSVSEIHLNTPSVSVRPARPGAFRISLTDAGESEITARAGDVEIFTPKGTQWVYAGQTMMARGDIADPEFQVQNAIPVDAWDQWNDSRDRSMQSNNSAQYVPAGVSGTDELDGAGTWVNVAPYGYVWRPAVAAGWAPYRNGRWVWIKWYGWTWVSADSWGWAPYHYGRWFFDNRWGWAWYPGGVGVTASWSPALVGFFGYGGVGVGVGFGGFGNVGWVPLAPYETFHPWWGSAYAGVNITNINVTAAYRNARVANGISGMAAGDFTAGRFSNVQRVTGAQVQTAGLVNGRLPLNPSVASRRFSDRAVANIPRNTPTPAARTGGASSAQSGYHRFGEPGAGSVNNRPQAATGNGQRQGSLQRFGEPGRTPSAQGAGGWKSFGTPGRASPSRQPYNPPQQQNQQNRNNGTGAQQNQRPAQNNSAPAHAAPAPAARPAPRAPAKKGK
jgi:hypothetical protein